MFAGSENLGRLASTEWASVPAVLPRTFLLWARRVRAPYPPSSIGLLKAAEKGCKASDGKSPLQNCIPESLRESTSYRPNPLSAEEMAGLTRDQPGFSRGSGRMTHKTRGSTGAQRLGAVHLEGRLAASQNMRSLTRALHARSSTSNEWDPTRASFSRPSTPHCAKGTARRYLQHRLMVLLFQLYLCFYSTRSRSAGGSHSRALHVCPFLQALEMEIFVTPLVDDYYSQQWRAATAVRLRARDRNHAAGRVGLPDAASDAVNLGYGLEALGGAPGASARGVRNVGFLHGCFRFPMRRLCIGPLCTIALRPQRYCGRVTQ
ncbi:hypothetical protein B0H11DRAFT_271516 [Mycena galericulata]|nr:hypothetical protein B0H11DRAFT_271516 [Mycena galericulata]